MPVSFLWLAYRFIQILLTPSSDEPKHQTIKGQTTTCRRKCVLAAQCLNCEATSILFWIIALIPAILWSSWTNHDSRWVKLSLCRQTQGCARWWMLHRWEQLEEVNTIFIVTMLKRSAALINQHGAHFAFAVNVVPICLGAVVTRPLGVEQRSFVFLVRPPSCSCETRDFLPDPAVMKPLLFGQTHKTLLPPPSGTHLIPTWAPNPVGHRRSAAAPPSQRFICFGEFSAKTPKGFSPLPSHFLSDRKWQDY